MQMPLPPSLLDWDESVIDLGSYYFSFANWLGSCQDFPSSACQYWDSVAVQI